jgi:anti-sigma factor RsiW
MTCDRLADLLEPIASGEIAADADIASHVSSCPACARALETARSLDSLLRSRPAPAAPAHFTSRVVARIHRSSWRREQIIDWIFNGAMIAAALLLASGLWIALRQSGVDTVARDAVQAFNSEMLAAAQKVAPSLPLYAGATGLIIVALGVWWWASDSPAL